MMATYSPAERRALARAVAVGEVPPCPACGTVLNVREVAPPAGVSYVRRRVWLLCPSCKRTAAVDVREGGPPSSRPDLGS